MTGILIVCTTANNIKTVKVKEVRLEQTSVSFTS